MANIVKCGSLYLDGHIMPAGQAYIPGQQIAIQNTVSEKELLWVVTNGMLIADRCLLVDISWDDLDEQSLVFGKPVSIDGVDYVCRLLKVGNKEGVPNEWDAALDTVRNENNDLWHWRKIAFWGQETPDVSVLQRRQSDKTLRGCNAVRNWYLNSSFCRGCNCGFRPVLDPVKTDPDKITLHDYVSIWCGQSILNGYLAEQTQYDWVIVPDQTSTVSAQELDRLIAPLPEGRVLIDRAGISAVQVLHT